jgi:hypothetical protein
MLEGGRTRFPDESKKNSKMNRVNAIILFHKRGIPAAASDRCGRSLRREPGRDT